MAITGHQNLREVETYTWEVERRKLAQTGMGTILDVFPEVEPGTKMANP